MKKLDIIGSIIMSSLDTCTRMTKASKEDEVNRILTLIESIEDNPVPSIDKTKIEKAFNKEFYNGQFVELHSGDYERVVEVILELQNGVTTDNEQPNKCFCNNNDKTCIKCY